MCSLALSLHKHLYNSIISSCASLKQVANLSSFFYRFHFNSSNVRHSVDNERKKGSISHLRFVHSFVNFKSILAHLSNMSHNLLKGVFPSNNVQYSVLPCFKKKFVFSFIVYNLKRQRASLNVSL